MRKEIRDTLMIDDLIHININKNKMYRKKLIYSLLNDKKYGLIAYKLALKHIDIKLYYVQGYKYMYFNNSSAFYKLRASEINYIYDFILQFNKLSKTKYQNNNTKPKQIYQDKKANNIILNYKDNYIVALQKYRKYYFDIKNNVRVKIKLTDLEKEIYEYTNKKILNNNESYIKQYMYKKLHKNDYPRLRYEYYENEELYNLIDDLIDERKFLKRI